MRSSFFLRWSWAEGRKIHTPSGYSGEGGHTITGGDPNTVEATFVRGNRRFHDVDQGARRSRRGCVVAEFCRAVRAELPATGGSEVKTIGDAVMLSIRDAAEALLPGLRVTR